MDNEKPKSAQGRGTQKSFIQEAEDAIYNMYQNQALKGNLGSKAKVAMEENMKRKKNPYQK